MENNNEHTDVLVLKIKIKSFCIIFKPDHFNQYVY